ncbi:MAG: hypothetical protein ACREWJ_00745 [Rhodoferax sp.]
MERIEPPYHLGICMGWDFDEPVVQRHYPPFTGWQPLRRLKCDRLSSEFK